MKCACGSDTKVVDTRLIEDKQRRRRVCLTCGNRFNTLEVLESELTRYTVKPIEEPKQEEPKVKTPYVRKETAQKIKEKKTRARHMLEDMKWQRELEDDLFWNGEYQDEHTY
jgi:transcriptional regulator NrdR family protein